MDSLTYVDTVNTNLVCYVFLGNSLHTNPSTNRYAVFVGTKLLSHNIL